MTIPVRIYAGDTLEFDFTISEYSDDDGYVGHFLLNSAAIKYDITGTGVGTLFTFNQTSTQTGAWLPGKYNYLIYSAKAPEQYTIERGEIQVHANLVIAATDIRTHAQKVLDSICAVLEKRANSDQRDFQLPGGVSISKLDHTELLTFKRKYENIRQQEIDDEKFKDGKTNSNIIKAQFL